MGGVGGTELLGQGAGKLRGQTPAFRESEVYMGEGLDVCWWPWGQGWPRARGLGEEGGGPAALSPRFGSLDGTDG